ncbi:hypothetical protein Tco_1084501, partial [Tanacetum coccineum]
KECFANSVPLDSVGINLQLVLKKKKGRSMVKVTRKRKHQYYKKINRFMKIHGKRVSVEAGKGRLGGLVALNDHEVDDDLQLNSTLRGQGNLRIKVRTDGGDVVRLGAKLERLWCKVEVYGGVCGGDLAAADYGVKEEDVELFRTKK